LVVGVEKDPVHGHMLVDDKKEVICRLTDDPLSTFILS